MARTPKCLHCGKPATQAKGSEIYPRSPHLKDAHFWRCKPCDAHVGCHKPAHRNGYKAWLPLGRPANSATRRARAEVHAVLDPIWQAGKSRKSKAALRHAVYQYLSMRMKLDRSKTHIGMFTYTQCYAAMRILRARPAAEIKTILEMQIESDAKLAKTKKRKQRQRR